MFLKNITDIKFEIGQQYFIVLYSGSKISFTKFRVDKEIRNVLYFKIQLKSGKWSNYKNKLNNHIIETISTDTLEFYKKIKEAEKNNLISDKRKTKKLHNLMGDIEKRYPYLKI